MHWKYVFQRLAYLEVLMILFPTTRGVVLVALATAGLFGCSATEAMI